MRGTFAFLLIAWFNTIGTSAAEVHLTMQDGLVTLNASHATVAEILAEWERVGQTRIVNGEKIAGEPVSIELTNVPEGQALEAILSSVAGYVARPRADRIGTQSRFDRIVVLPTSAPPSADSCSSRPATGTPTTSSTATGGRPSPRPSTS